LLILSFSAFDRRDRILNLDPVARAPGTVERAEPLRHDAFETEFASVAKYDVAGLGDVVI